MSGKTRAVAIAAALALGLTACFDRATAPTGSIAAPDEPALSSSGRSTEANATTNWNRLATSLQARHPAPPVMRFYTYLSLAQLRAAEAAKADRRDHLSTSAAIGGASAAFLTSRFPLEAVEIADSLAAQAAAVSSHDAKHQDFARGEAVGRAAAARVIAYSLDDRVNVALPGVSPTTPGHWLGTSPIHFAYGARPFFLKAPDEFRPVEPPAFGSAAFNAAAAEVLQIALTRTTVQDSIARYWAANQSLASDAAMNNLAVELIRTHHRSETEAARILFLMNAAAFDASIACYTAKFDYWYIRPAQFDPRIVTVFPAPNHPSYPSGHSCHSGSATGVLTAIFPSEGRRLAAIADEASLSRLYAGIHYRFDMVGGLALGRAVAAKAMRADLDDVAIR